LVGHYFPTRKNWNPGNPAGPLILNPVLKVGFFGGKDWYPYFSKGGGKEIINLLIGNGSKNCPSDCLIELSRKYSNHISQN